MIVADVQNSCYSYILCYSNLNTRGITFNCPPGLISVKTDLIMIFSRKVPSLSRGLWCVTMNMPSPVRTAENTSTSNQVFTTTRSITMSSQV